MEHSLQKAMTLPVEAANDDMMLCQRIRNGDEHAFTPLYERHKQAVYTHCVRFLGEGGAAEDIFHDVMIKCYEQLRAGMEIANVRAYLMTAARNRCYNVIRDDKRPIDIDVIGEALPAEALDPGDVMDIRAALLTLKPHHREALVQFEYLGHRYDEIAEIMELPVSKVRQYIFKAREGLRAYFSHTPRRRNGS